MIDRALSVFLLLSFGVTGMAILIMAWIQPMPASERILTTLVGATGIFLAVSRAWLLRTIRPETDSEPGLVEVEEKS